MSVKKTTNLSDLISSVQSDQTSMTDVEIAPDGRIYLFGASAQFLELLRACGLSDEFMLDRLPQEVVHTETP